ncbi:class I SAM-dependent methyltransferase [Leifsonia sp. Leaf264]|uniref:class I SAM-dependent methyltransferase n=1 Tax=Leifsonia sp. Leaf264 TaxID=1736314 RepID=UPI0006F7B49C|nr:class I SAM-dependent methyltransferase [Leifsonia sp. Leaf264]KQO95805.1 SAM-dependent methyltransferase [Leifsonia sp. Leaf264]
MSRDFDKDYWEQHWHGGPGSPADPMTDAAPSSAANPYVQHETAGLAPGTALDAGCGAGAEAVWLAEHGWTVTGADISASALAQAADRAGAASVTENVTWIEADLTTWEPAEPFDLVTTNYAHPTIPQLDFYRRISRWVAPGGTLLIVGHLHGSTTTANGHHPPEETTVTAGAITAVLDAAHWRVETAEEPDRTVDARGHGSVHLRDVVVRATRLA